MKILNSLKSAALLFIVICSFFSCRLQTHDPETVTYNLLLNYADISGNDLVKGLVDVDSTTSRLYKLEIILPEPCDNRKNGSYHLKGGNTASPLVFYKLFNDRYYFTAYFALPVDGCPTTRMITHKVKCPELFGDDAVREIVSYWDIPKKTILGVTYYAKCYRIEFEGKEITPSPIDKEAAYIATIILNY